MGIPKAPKPVKYFVALLSSNVDLLTAIESDLTAILGRVAGRSEILPWSVSRFYEKEMGSGLLRRFVSFAPLGSPAQLAQIKLQTGKVENGYRWRSCERKGRKVNLDPGYLEAGKVVLASTKDAGHRVYLHSGIYAETTLLYYDGAFHACPFTYPDYLWPETLSFLISLRSDYLEQLRQSM